LKRNALFGGAKRKFVVYLRTPDADIMIVLITELKIDVK